MAYPAPSGLLGRLRDDEYGAVRLTEQQRHIQRVESAQAALAALRIEVERVRAVPAAADAVLARLSAP